MAGAEERLDGTVSRVAVLRYDAFNETSGRQSSSVALLDEHGNGVVHLGDPAARAGARLREAARAGESELELSPEEREAMRLAEENAAPLKVTYLGPDRDLQRGGAARLRRRGASSSSPRGRRSSTAIQRRRARRGRTRFRALRELDRGLGALDPRRARLRHLAGPDRRRVRPPDPPQPDRPRASSRSSEIEVVLSHPQANAQCARFIREQPAARRGARDRQHQRRRPSGRRRRASPGRRSARPLRREAYGCRILREGVEDAADNVTRFVWLARRRLAAGARAPASSGARRSSSTSSATTIPGRWSRRCASSPTAAST